MTREKKEKKKWRGWGAVQAKSCSVCPKPIAEQWLALLILMGLLRLQVKHVLKSHTGSEIRIWYLHSHCPYTAAFRITEQIFKTTLEPAGDFFHPVWRASRTSTVSPVEQTALKEIPWVASHQTPLVSILSETICLTVSGAHTFLHCIPVVHPQPLFLNPNLFGWFLLISPIEIIM